MAPPSLPSKRSDRKKSDKPDNRSRLLDAAEQLFSERGFDGCTLRDIADRAGVNQGMIHYFFRTKENVFREAYFRRGADITANRLRLLDEEEARADGQPIKLARLLEIFLRPAYDVATSGPSGRAFLRMQARLQLDNSPFSQEIRQALYDESSQRFVQAFARSMPGVPYEEVHWRFTFLRGAYQYVLANTGRLEAISGHRLSGEAFQQALHYLLPFLEAGLRSPASEAFTPK